MDCKLPPPAPPACGRALRAYSPKALQPAGGRASLNQEGSTAMNLEFPPANKSVHFLYTPANAHSMGLCEKVFIFCTPPQTPIPWAFAEKCSFSVHLPFHSRRKPSQGWCSFSGHIRFSPCYKGLRHCVQFQDTSPDASSNRHFQASVQLLEAGTAGTGSPLLLPPE